jgi:hypothetical protein
MLLRRRRLVVTAAAGGLVLLVIAAVVIVRPVGNSGETASTTSAPPSPSLTPTGKSVITWSSLVDYPGPSNTGVPNGTVLSEYGGPCTIIEQAAVIDSERINCAHLVIKAPDVKITRSIVLGWIDVDGSGATLTIEDSEVDAGSAHAPAVGFQGVTARRSNLHGGQHGALCGTNCLIEDSWLHGQALPDGESWHLNGYLSNGGSNVVLRHNTVACDQKPNAAGGGCSADASIFGDFSANSNYLFDSNLFIANPSGLGYCLYAGFDPGKPFGASATEIEIVNNIFERGANDKCGTYGAVTSFDANGQGNVWKNNIWDDATVVHP